jgi:hypothetical protein
MNSPDFSPSEALRRLLGGDPAVGRPLPENSRYATVGTAVHHEPDGSPVTYLRLRMGPEPSRFADRGEHVVAAGDRLDLLAARYLGDPIRFWQLCDANAAMHPEELEELGRRVRITLPADVPGPEARRA